MAGEILYLGQQKNAEYQIEAPGLPEENKAYPREETKEEKADREAKAKEAHEAEVIFQKESKAREEQLKKDRAEGKTKLLNAEQRKAITDQRVDLRAKLKKAIEEYAAKYGINKWRDLIELGQRYKIFHTGITSWHTAMDLLCDHPDKCLKFKEFIKTDQEIATGDIPF